LFATYGLAPRGAFRNIGEQIDGSFNLSGHIYLLEAKWQAQLIGNHELQSFAGTVRTKSPWTRGLYISYSGFSIDGLQQFSQGSATPIVCISGNELWQIFEKGLSFPGILEAKVRKTAETGQAHYPLDSLS
jgi:hypothetical protein